MQAYFAQSSFTEPTEIQRRVWPLACSGRDVIAQVLRCFSGDAAHVEGSIDPLRDAETVETELMLADLESVERQLFLPSSSTT